MEFEILCLQKHPEFLDQSVELLNSQWPRSKTARLRSLDQGCQDGLPTSLVLIDKQYGRGKEKVVAHSKISPVPSNDKMCFVESVVVAAHLRGKGLGRLLMKETEQFVLSKGITTVYLTTYDQQAFYEKLGYALSEPIVVYGGPCQNLNKIVEKNLKKMQISESAKTDGMQKNPTPIAKTNDTISSNWQNAPASCSSSILKETIKINATCPPPPPPPPAPPFDLKLICQQICKNAANMDINILNNLVKVTMKKDLL